MKENNKIRVLFVCTGNICRSPMAEAVFRNLVAQAGLSDRFDIASAGTGHWHIGQPPHRGTQKVLQAQKVPLSPSKTAQLVKPGDLQHYDYIIAMDQEHVGDLNRHPKVRRLLEFASASPTLDVPDPYYTGGFDEVYELVLAGSQGLLEHIRRQEGL